MQTKIPRERRGSTHGQQADCIDGELVILAVTHGSFVIVYVKLKGSSKREVEV